LQAKHSRNDLLTRRRIPKSRCSNLTQALLQLELAVHSQIETRPDQGEIAGGANAETMKRVRSLSVAAPAYNEGEGIVPVVDHWLKYLRGRADLEAFEIVICNDGSRDNTAERLKTIKASRSELVVIDHPVNQGAGAAVATAISGTTCDWVLLIDSDGQFAIENFDVLLNAVQTMGAPAAIGVRTKKLDSSFARFGSWSSGLLCNLFHGTRYRDFNSACKLVKGDLLRSLHLECKGLNYSTDVTSKLIERGVQIAEVEIVHLPRVAGTSSLRKFRGARDRFLFVMYLGFRQFLIRMRILRASKYEAS
jgi:dolichol-phosphate mannosyltransferase